MTSIRQLMANRANARKSTGPKTPDGKARLVPVRHVPRSDGARAFRLRLNTGRYRDQSGAIDRGDKLDQTGRIST